MSAVFVPLKPGKSGESIGGTGQPNRLTVIRADESGPFTPLHPKKKADTNPSQQSDQGASAHQPRLSVRKEGDRVVEVRIECVCGQVMELACDYAAPEAS